MFDEKYMQIALRLAKRGIGSVEPNPVVGAVIVKNSRITGRGWHRKFGGPHAEINALEDCKKLGDSPQGATMYITLEPCCHYAKTPPCTDAIIAAGLAKVVVATVDPSQHANGAGLRQLRNARIEVQTGVCEREARLLNAPFIKFATTGKCWVILKWAQTIDGKLAYAQTSHESRITSHEYGWISNEKSRKDVQKLRRRAQAILVGVNTVIADNPLLTTRSGQSKQLARVILDSKLRVPLDCNLLATARDKPVFIVTTDQPIKTKPAFADEIKKRGAEIIIVPILQGRCDIESLLDELSRRGIAQLLVEGGPTVITSFLKEQLADEICIYIAPKILGSSGSASITEPMSELADAFVLHYVDIKRFGEDIRLTGLTEKAVKDCGILT